LADRLGAPIDSPVPLDGGITNRVAHQVGAITYTQMLNRMPA
jgi:hypothetical protein